MKVAMLIRRFTTTGGAERYAVEVASRLAERCELHVFAQEFGAEPSGVRLHRLQRISETPRYLNQLHFSMQCARLRGKFDIIHSHERVAEFDVLTIHCPTFRGGYLGGRTGGRRALRLLNAGLSPRILYYLRQEAAQFSRRPGRRFIAVSRHVMNDVLSLYPLDESDFDIAYPGVDIERFRPATGEEKREARNRFKLPSDQLIVSFVGTEFARKGLFALIEAMGQLRGKRVSLLVAGGGDAAPYLHRAKELGVAEQILFAGLVSDVNAIYAASDLYILPTLSDPCPMAPLEAMASGLPAIISNARVTGVAEHMRNNEAILLDDPRSGEEIAGAIERMFDDVTRKTIAQRGLQLVRGITWEGTADKTMNVYKKSIAIN